MADFFIYNNNGVLPGYTPGIPGYGQIGSTGDTGDTGASVYYCAFDLSNPVELKTANSYIQENKELSNNTVQKISGEYIENDIIIDCTGGIYKLVACSEGLEIFQYGTKTSSSVYTSDVNGITGLDVYCATAFLNTSLYCWKTASTYSQAYVEEATYKIPDDGGSGEYSGNTESTDTILTYVGFPHKTRYRNKIEDQAYGNYVKFDLQTSNESSYNRYVYVLCFPNGQVFKQMSDVTTAKFFIDNRYIYGMFDVKSWMNGSMKTGDGASLYGIGNLKADEVDKCLADLIEFNGVNEIYSDIAKESDDSLKDSSMNNEHKKDATVLCSEFIKYNCTAYVDIFNTKTNKSYRIDFDDIFITSSTDEDSDKQITTAQATNIESVKNNIIWKIYDYPAHAWLNNPAYDMDAYVPFVVDDASTVDEYLVRCYFVTRNSRTDENDKSALESYINENVSTLSGLSDDVWNNWAWHDSSAGNRVIRVYFRNLNTFSLAIKYSNKGKCVDNDGTVLSETSYPTTMVYVSAPDCNLIQYGKDSEYNKKIEDLAETNSLTKVSGVIEGCDPGIYYLNKFVAPGIDTSGMSGNVMEAGLTDYTLTCSTYGLDPGKYHYIEIGFVPFTTSDNKEYHVNIPADKLENESDAVPQRVIYNIGGEEILPFHIPGNALTPDNELTSVSGDFDLTLNLYAITDSVGKTSDSTAEDGSEISYNPLDYVYKDIV